MTSNVLEFYVKMKDLMSGGLAKLAQNSQSTFTKIRSHVAGAVNQTKFMSNSVDELRYKLKQVNEVRFGTVMKSEFRTATASAKKLERQISRLDGTSRRSGLFSGRNLISKAASYIGPLAIGMGAMSFGTGSVKAAMDFQAQTKSYQVLTGSKTIGTELANQLRQLKQDTIMGVAVYANAQKMLSFGIDSNKIIPDLKMLGDVSMGDSQKLKRLTIAFSETEAAGKLTGRRLLQFVNAGFNPLLEISKKTGKSMEELTKDMSHGAISSGMVEEAFKVATSEGGRFNHMMDQMAGTTYGKLKLLEGQWANFKIIIGEQLIPVATKLLDWAREILIWIEKNGTELWFWIKALGETVLAIKAVSMFIVPLIEGLGSAAIGFEATGVAATGALGPLGLLAAAITGLVTLYNYLGDAMNRANSNSQTFNKTAYDAEKNQLSRIISTYDDKRKASYLAQVKGRLEGSVAQTQKEFANIKAVELGHGIGGKLTENVMHSLQSKGVELSLYQSQLKAVNDLLPGKKGAADIKGTGKVSAGDSGEKSSVASSIAGGGPRVINIHIGKMVEKLEVHANSIAEGMNDMERQVQEVFLRVLNSGASVQG